MNYSEIDKLIKKYRERLDYQLYMTPINFKEENEKFLQYYINGKVYNPQYKYNKFEKICVDFSKIKERLSAAEDGIGYILYQSLLSLEKEVLMYSLIGEDELFTPVSNLIYSTPALEYFNLAVDQLKNNSTKEEAPSQYKAAELAELIKERLASYGFVWNVIILDNMASRISVEPEQKTIYINGCKTFSKADVVRLQVHEVDTHVLRVENGQRQGYSVFASGTAGSLIHEEGLALYNEWKNNVQDEDALKLYAARFICCCKMELSFYEMFDMLIKLGCSLSQTMYVVSRIKRGISDTSKPGGFVKDYVYFQGLNEVRSYLDQKQSAYDKLYFGSISIGDTFVLEQEIARSLNNGTIVLPQKLIF